jgi:XTP/dITP diphosphohydrolase
MRLVLASNNAKKLLELRSLFEGLPVELVAQGELGIPEAEEPHVTFVENALAKARHAALASQGAALADDSGLCVDALGGAPGVVSARYAALHGGEPGDAGNNRMLLSHMAGRANRRASFVSVLVAVRHADDPEPLIAQGRWSGTLLEAPAGDAGFGYDPLLFIPELGCSVGQLSADAKNRVSHRALAAAALRAQWAASWFA